MDLFWFFLSKLLFINQPLILIARVNFFIEKYSHKLIFVFIFERTLPKVITRA